MKIIHDLTFPQAGDDNQIYYATPVTGFGSRPESDDLWVMSGRLRRFPSVGDEFITGDLKRWEFLSVKPRGNGPDFAAYVRQITFNLDAMAEFARQRVREFVATEAIYHQLRLARRSVDYESRYNPEHVQ